jgi:hypothetical protein
MKDSHALIKIHAKHKSNEAYDAQQYPTSMHTLNISNSMIIKYTMKIIHTQVNNTITEITYLL